MKAFVAAALLLAAGALSCGHAGSARARAGGCSGKVVPPAIQAGQQTLFGHIVSLRRAGARFVLRFDPAWHLSGYPAEEVMLAQTGSRDVPNDSVEVDETHRALSFLVPASARVTVLQHAICPTPATVAYLAAHAGSHRNGFWVTLAARYPNPVLELDEQYHP
jgi:hypothetical protein